MLMYRVQIELPPYPDYESLERKLTLAIECVSVPNRCFRFIHPIISPGRPLDLIENRGYLAYLLHLYLAQSSSFPSCLLRSLLVSHWCTVTPPSLSTRFSVWFFRLYYVMA